MAQWALSWFHNYSLHLSSKIEFEKRLETILKTIQSSFDTKQLKDLRGIKT